MPISLDLARATLAYAVRSGNLSAFAFVVPDGGFVEIYHDDLIKGLYGLIERSLNYRNQHSHK